MVKLEAEKKNDNIIISDSFEHLLSCLDKPKVHPRH